MVLMISDIMRVFMQGGHHLPIVDENYPYICFNSFPIYIILHVVLKSSLFESLNQCCNIIILDHAMYGW